MTNQLLIKNLQVSTDNKQILKGINLTVNKGEIHALMGPNGSGKSTLAFSLMGHPSYKIKDSVIKLNGEDILKLDTFKRAKKGLYLAMQNPVSIPGVSVYELFTNLYNNSKENKPLKSVSEYYAFFTKIISKLDLSETFLKRSLNEGFSGGEKKKLEIAQLLIMKPKFIILDEIDTGLDIDSLKTISKILKEYISSEIKPGVLLISHYQRIFNYLKPDFVHVMKEGKIVKSGNFSLIFKIEKEGYAKV